MPPQIPEATPSTSKSSTNQADEKETEEKNIAVGPAPADPGNSTSKSTDGETKEKNIAVGSMPTDQGNSTSKSTGAIPKGCSQHHNKRTVTGTSATANQKQKYQSNEPYVKNDRGQFHNWRTNYTSVNMVNTRPQNYPTNNRRTLGSRLTITTETTPRQHQFTFQNRPQNSAGRPSFIGSKTTNALMQNNRAFIIGQKYLEQTLEKEPAGILRAFSDKKTEFDKLFSKPMTPDIIVLIVKILSRICETTFENSKGEILSSVCNSSRFITELQQYVITLSLQHVSKHAENVLYYQDADSFWKSLIAFFDMVISLIPNTACDKLYVMMQACKMNMETELDSKVKITEDTRNKFQKLMTKFMLCFDEREKKKEKRKVADEKYEEPPDNFRTISVYPKSEDIISNERVFLRPNITCGAYHSVEHYLDVQFRLLREDFICPLRDGITDLCFNEVNRKKRFNTGVRIYPRTKFVSPYISTSVVGILLDFQADKRSADGKVYNYNKRVINWEQSKRFMFGSLLCFTMDKFNTIIFGTVAERDIERLRNGYVIVKICEEYSGQVNQLYGKEFLMVENEVYFEPYYHVLRALQTMNEDNFPMQNYLVDVLAESRLPTYVKAETEYKCNGTTIHVSDSNSWPTAEKLKLNISQYRAFQIALMKEFAIIQGPPGTGKTYLGLKIASTLLKNLRHKQMLVVCYTNHALDQFLEGLMPVTEEIIRVGNRSKNEKLDKFNLSRNSGRISHGTFLLRDRVKEVVNKLQSKQKDLEMLNSCDGIIDITRTNIFPQFTRVGFFPQYKYSNFPKFVYWLLGFKVDDKVDSDYMHVDNNKVCAVDEGNMPEIVNYENLHDPLDDIHRPEYENDLEFENIANIAGDLKYAVSQSTLFKSIQELNADIFNIQNKLMEDDSIKKYGEELYDEHFNKNIKCKDKERVYGALVLRLKQFTEHKIGNMRNVYDILEAKGPECNLEERWSLYSYALYTLRRRAMKEIADLNLEYCRLYKVYEEQKQIDDLRTLEMADVIGMTTTSAARLQSVIKQLKIPIVIIEEAAEVPESHIIVSLTMHCEHLILIGDHQQLKPSTAAFKLAKKYNLDISLFERMLNNGMHCARLDVQHRMRPEICQLICPNIYEDLKNHESVAEFPDVLGMKKTLFFIKHNVYEDNLNDEDTITRKNIHEALFIIRLCRHLILQGYAAERITILTTYTGQMFLIRAESKKHNILEGVKVTAVDNFQGEENDIILLSLVRSNSEAKIGFLKTENRVCVALSRAKIGLYIIGNMDNLVSSSEIWPKIDETLQKMAAIDTHLVLCCQLHPDMETKVACAQDFDKAPEGGCNRLCNTLLRCGHYCKSICHISDREHEYYKCKEPCNRSCKREHPCQNLCFQDCNDCKVIVTKELKCGHKHDLRCGFDREKHTCNIQVTTILPHCKHEVIKPCHADAKTFQCTFPCENRLDCGHKCERKCHVVDDPDHIEYKCHKPCPKLYKGCTNTHACQKLCFEECPPCSIKVKKTRKDCAHSRKMACAEDIDSTICNLPCKRTLPCGHHCKMKCSDPCGNCKVVVKKTIQECRHIVNMLCHWEPVIKNCNNACIKKLPCGHDCKKLCKEECTKQCRVLIKSDRIKSACGHFARIPCYQSNMPEEHFTKTELLQNCKEKCVSSLRCGHKCSGTCAECFQGRIHTICGEACGNTLVCQHSCKVPCREYCPPCKEKCTYRCVHSKCPKQCGVPCVTCQEPCEWKCPHKRCTRKCGQICNRTGCNEPCLEELKCGHPCIGLCGEKCPKLCRICNEEEVKTIMFGDEDQPDARFILLEECGHVFEVGGLDKWFSMDNTQEISPKLCPKCKTIVNLTPRYANACKLAYENIMIVKKRLFGKPDENKKKTEYITNKIDLLINNSLDFCGVSTPYKNLLNEVKSKAQRKYKKRQQILSSNDIIHIDRILEIMTKINKMYKLVKTEKNQKFIAHSDLILNAILNVKHCITDQFLDDVTHELSRLHWIAELCKIESSAKYLTSKHDKKVEDSHTRCETNIISIVKFSDDLAIRAEHHLAELLLAIKSSSVITPEDKRMILSAMNFQKAGHWYTCPNGHVYCITECGGAMVESKCPDCGCIIGGSSHRLRADNRVATEMDGATRPAFS